MKKIYSVLDLLFSTNYDAVKFKKSIQNCCPMLRMLDVTFCFNFSLTQDTFFNHFSHKEIAL